MKKRAILYLRRSDGKQEASLKKQMKWAKNAADKLGVALNASLEALEKMQGAGDVESGDMYLDDAVPGSNMLRPGLKAFRDRTLNGNGFTHVMAYDRDRLARPDDPAEAVSFEHKIRTRGIFLVFADLTLAPLGINECDLAHGVTGFIGYNEARQYAVRLSRHVATARKDNAVMGVSGGGRPPYGFVRAFVVISDGSIKTVFPNGTHAPKTDGHKVVFLPGTHPKVKEFLTEEEFKKHSRALTAVELVHRLYRTGKGFRAIARILDAKCFETPSAGWKRSAKRWSTSAVKGIIENPIYYGKVGAGRYAEGKYSRVVYGGGADVRDVEPGELVDGQSRKGRSVVNRDPSQWGLYDPPIPYRPIVPPEIWHLNIERLRLRGTEGKQRGIPRHRDPNRYPVRLICGDCGQPMAGTTVNGERRYKCATYTESAGKECFHNYVPRDVVVWFTVYQIRQVVRSASNREALKAAVRSIIDETPQSQDGAAKLARLKQEIEDAEKQFRVAYKDKLGADNDEIRGAASEACDDLLMELRAMKHKASEIRSKEAFQQGDNTEEEVERTLAVLDHLHLFLGRVRESQLRDTCDSLGIRVTLHFKHEKTKKTVRTKPSRIELQIGANGRINPPEGVAEAAKTGTTAKPEKSKKAKKKAKNAHTAGNGRKSKKLRKGGGGGRIRTAG